MPVGFNSPARNFFLLGSTGAQVVTNFFKRIDQSASIDEVYIPDEIRYNVPDQKFLLSGTNQTTNAKEKGWLEKRSAGGSLDWKVEIQSSEASTDTTLRALQLDSNDNLIVCGKTGTIPWVAKYTNNGQLTWQVTSNTSGVEYTGIAVDNTNNIYACGSSSTQAYIEKISGSGSYSWGKYSSNTAGAITFLKCAVNDRGHVVAVGKIEDTTKDKGYIAKVDTATGELLWDKTIEDHRLATSNSYWQTECTDVYIDGNDQIYVVGTITDLVANKNRGFIIKYTAEGNMIWQSETAPGNNIQYINVKSDTETQQTVAIGLYIDSSVTYGIITKYSQNGTITWRRRLGTSYTNNLVKVNLDADPSFYYLLFIDESIDLLSGKPDSYVFGKVSTSGNGFGNFTYNDGVATISYNTLNVLDNIGKLYDGSVRQDSSDLITYPFGANKILFDDLATQVANKKVQVDEAGTYSDPTYSITTSYPKISTDDIVYDSSLLLNYNFNNKASYSGSGTAVSNLSSSSYTGTLNGSPVYNSSGYLVFDGTNDYISFDSISVSSFTYEGWIYSTPSGTADDYGYFYNGGTYGLALSEGGNAGIGLTTGEFYYYNSSTAIDLNYKLSANEWNHIVSIVDGSSKTIELYVNGFLQSTIPVTNTQTNVDTLGRYSPGTTHYLTGRNAEARIYNRKLTSTEIVKNFNSVRSKYGLLYNATTPTFISLYSDTYSGTTWFNKGVTSQGNLIATNGPVFSVSNGYVTFDGVDDYAVHSGFQLSTQIFNLPSTIEMWIYPTSFTSNDGDTTQFILTTGAANGVDFALEQGKLRYRYRNNVTGQYDTLTTPTSLTTNKWYYVVGTDNRATGQLKLYVKSDTTQTGTLNSIGGPRSFSSVSGLVVGAYRPDINGTGSFHYVGRIGMINAYTTVFSEDYVNYRFNLTRNKYGV